VHSCAKACVLSNQVDDLIRVVYSAVGKKKDVCFLIVLLGHLKDRIQRTVDVSSAEVSHEGLHLVKRLFKCFFVVNHASLVLEEEFEL
jgi:hypothetical protein